MTPEALDGIAAVTSLERLEVGSIPLTDDGLRRLARLTSLKTLVVESDKVTYQGARAFQAAVPGCELLPKRRKPE